MNLYLYLPLHSTHSPISLLVLVFVILQIYWKQKSNRLDNIKFTKNVSTTSSQEDMPHQTSNHHSKMPLPFYTKKKMENIKQEILLCKRTARLSLLEVSSKQHLVTYHPNQLWTYIQHYWHRPKESRGGHFSTTLGTSCTRIKQVTIAY